MSDPILSQPPRKTNLPPALGKVVAFWQKLSRPMRILIVSTFLGVAVLASWLGYRATNETYAVLFTELTSEDAAAVAAKLKEQKVPFRVIEGGRIEVPEARVHELRLDMAGAGLPRGGGVGFESFDKMKLGATEFEQKVLFRRALEGELSRTIGSIAAVENARVHLVLPERSVFAARREQGSASVVVKLRPGRELGAQEVGAVVHLVSSAVPGLSPDRVALATTEGALLRRPKPVTTEEADAGNAGLEEDQVHEVRTLERNLEERARTMLERVVGPGHVDVKVSAEMDFSRLERTEDRFKPQAPILRSEELTVERTAGTPLDPVAGVPGAESNLPTGDAPEGEPAAPDAQGVLRHQHTRNFEVDRITEKRISKSGTVKRLTVAVVVDGVPMTTPEGSVELVPREPEELDRLALLVKSAVGASDARGDSVAVDSMNFAGSELPLVDDAAPASPTAPVTQLDKVKKYAPYGVAAVLGLALVTTALIVRRRRKKAKAILEAEIAEAAEKAKEPEQLEAEPEVPQLSPREEALRRAEEDPATAALVLRAWLGGGSEEEEEEEQAA